MFALAILNKKTGRYEIEHYSASTVVHPATGEHICDVDPAQCFIRKYDSLFEAQGKLARRENEEGVKGKVIAILE